MMPKPIISLVDKTYQILKKDEGEKEEEFNIIYKGI